MLVYRTQSQQAQTASLITALAQHLRQFPNTNLRDHDQAVALLIEAGVLEASVCDALAPEQDGVHPVASALRQISLRCGHVLYHSWKQQFEQVARWLSGFAEMLEELQRLYLPASVPVSVPEGYAYYGLYPETYLAAAEQFYQTELPAQVVCLGLRSLGTSLSAVVAATLRELGLE